jgi:deoxycytidine triphosphate deaminase
MSVLSDLDIKKELIEGNIIIEPYDENQLGNCSYDVKLGENYYEWNHESNLLLYNPYNSDHVNKYWKLKQAHIPDEYFCNKYGIFPGSKIIILKPHETILSHTIEFIGGVNDITTEMKARSSYGRSGISVCKCSSWGDIKYFNRWTMEIQNSLNIPVILTVGERIAQIVFHRTGKSNTSYSTKGSYQKEDNLVELKALWKPDSMLPKIKSEASKILGKQ